MLMRRIMNPGILHHIAGFLHIFHGVLHIAYVNPGFTDIHPERILN